MQSQNPCPRHLSGIFVSSQNCIDETSSSCVASEIDGSVKEIPLIEATVDVAVRPGGNSFKILKI